MGLHNQVVHPLDTAWERLKQQWVAVKFYAEILDDPIGAAASFAQTMKVAPAWLLDTFAGVAGESGFDLVVALIFGKVASPAEAPPSITQASGPESPSLLNRPEATGPKARLPEVRAVCRILR